MVRITLVAVFAYSLVLALAVGIRQLQLRAELHDQLAMGLAQSIEKRPIEHKYTLFSSIVIDKAVEDLPILIDNWQGTVDSYEIVTLSACNPRIRYCG